MADTAVKAQQFLDEMGLGQRQVDQCYLYTEYWADTAEYRNCVTAVPAIQRVPAIHRPQLGSVKSKNAYASNWYLTDTRLEFSAEGKLVSFNHGT